MEVAINQNKDTYSQVPKVIVPQLKEKKFCTIFSYVSKEELSAIKLNSRLFSFLLTIHRSVLIAKKQGKIFIFFLTVVMVVITNKTSNFTTRSVRDRRRTKEIANTLLIFKLSFIQKNRYLQQGLKTLCLTIERTEKYHSFVRFHKGNNFATVKQLGKGG